MRTFGEEATAILTGWRWSVDHGAYIRVSATGDGFMIEASQPGSLPGVRANAVLAGIEWWHSNVLLRLCERLEQAREGWRPEVKETTPIRGYESWLCGADGKTITDDSGQNV